MSNFENYPVPVCVKHVVRVPDMGYVIKILRRYAMPSRPHRLLPSQEFLREHFFYDPETGQFLHRCPLTKDPIDRSKVKDPRSKYRITIIGKTAYPTHRLCYLYYHGPFDESFQIDHINCDKHDNRINNLRLATVREQMRNRPIRKDNRTGFKGITFDLSKQRYRARIRVENKRLHIGWFDNPEDAYKAFVEAAAALHGEFSRVV